MPGVRTIGDNVFEGTLLTKVEMPAVTILGFRAFYSATNLTEVSMPKVEKISDQAFWNTSVKSLTLPESVTELSGSTFSGMNLEALTISLKTLENATISPTAFATAFSWTPTITLTGVAEKTVTLNEHSVSIDDKTINMSQSPDFQITNITDITNSTIINHSGAAVTIDGKTLADNNVLVVGEVENNAYLAGLSVDEGTLTPAFSNLTTAYQVSLSNEVSDLVVTAVPQSDKASVTINGTAANTENEYTVTCPLGVGDNTITVIVAAADGTTTQTYTIHATRNEALQDLKISTPEELLAFAQDVNNGRYNDADDITVELTQDIDMNGKEWTPIGTSSGWFKGTFDGKGHTIKNLALSSNTKNGLFGLAFYCTIQNVNVSGTYHREAATSRTYEGIIAADAQHAIIKNCTSDLTVTGDMSYAAFGGIVGMARNSSQIIDCTSNTTINASVSPDNGSSSTFNYVGGVVGWIYSSNVVVKTAPIMDP